MELQKKIAGVKLIDGCTVCNVDIPEGVTEEQFYAVMNKVVDAIDNMPTISCCEMCKHWDASSGLSARKCDKWDRFTKRYDFCSYCDVGRPDSSHDTIKRRH